MNLTPSQLNVARSRAIYRWVTQPVCPNSPGQFNDVVYSLCLGATLAECLTFALVGRECAREFISALSANGSKAGIIAQMHRLGYSREYGEEKVFLNDMLPSISRRASLINTLQMEATYCDWVADFGGLYWNPYRRLRILPANP
jgi:hypothetical protein